MMSEGWVDNDFELLTENDIPGAAMQGECNSAEVLAHLSWSPNW